MSETLRAWVAERLANCERIAATKTGADRDGWLEDAANFRALLSCVPLSKNTAPEHWKLPLPPEAHVTRWKGVDLDPPATTYEEAEARASRLDRMDAPEALASPQADAVNGVLTAAPEGWKLVPIDATIDMLDAARHMARNHDNGSEWIEKFWRCMVGAAPPLWEMARHSQGRES